MTTNKRQYICIFQEPRNGSFSISATHDLDRYAEWLIHEMPFRFEGYRHTFLCRDMVKVRQALHDMYYAQQVCGEWFLLNEQQLQALCAVQYCDRIKATLRTLPLPTEELRSKAYELSEANGIDEMLDTLPLPTEELRAQAKELRNK